MSDPLMSASRVAQGLKKLCEQIDNGKLKNRDKILERVGCLKGRFPKARSFVKTTVIITKPAKLEWSWDREEYKQALTMDGAYLLRSNQSGWTAREFWETYIRLTVIERAFRVLKSELLLQLIWPGADLGV